MVIFRPCLLKSAALMYGIQLHSETCLSWDAFSIINNSARKKKNELNWENSVIKMSLISYNHLLMPTKFSQVLHFDAPNIFQYTLIHLFAHLDVHNS